jgi:Arc/MetJ family transcription regulator
MRTNIVIDDDLIDLAIRTTGLKTKREVVEEGLKMLVRVKNQAQLKSLRGKLNWEGDIDKMRIDE